MAEVVARMFGRTRVWMVESIGLLLEMGVDRIEEHVSQILAPIRDGAERGFFDLTSPTDTAYRSAITCIRTSRVENVFHRLKAAGITCSLREGSIRVSPHCYNTIEELERVVELVR